MKKNRQLQESFKIPTERELMEMAVEEMKLSKAEARPDGKVLPKVGAVLLFPDGRIERAHRGELREGDHAEFTLLERKLFNEDISACTLFTTLEPCVERNQPKLPCCRRVTNARIKKVFVGIIDPDPTVSTNGIAHMQRLGVDVKMFDRDYQQIIENENREFLKQALQRRNNLQLKEPINPLDQPRIGFSFDQCSTEALQLFISSAKLPYQIDQPELQKYLADLGLLSLDESSGQMLLTGIGILLFGKNPRNVYNQAAVKCTAQFADYKSTQVTFDQPLVLVPDRIEEWLKSVLGTIKDTTSFKRKDFPSFPIEILREAVMNAIVHRDYSIEGGKISINVTDYGISISSPGSPAASITLEQLNSFKAPSFSRNPKIAFIFNLMGYVEESGYGMRGFESIRDKYNLPLPVYKYDSPFLTLTFIRSANALKHVMPNENISKLTAAQLAGYEWLKTISQASTREYSMHFNIGYKTAQRHLARMRELSLIEDNGLDSNSPNYKYSVKYP